MPDDRADLHAWLRLTLVPGVPPGAQRALLRALGSPHAAVAASRREIATIAGGAVAEALARGPDARLLERTLEWLEAPGQRLIALGEPGYPRSLLDIHDPPTVIYAKGRIDLLNRPSFAIVGSRNATAAGKRDAQSLAAGLSQAGLTIVSGLALGIDAAAHRGGLEGEGSSVAVMGTAPDRVYPRGNHELAHALAENGCLVTEFPLGTAPEARNFPRRNRLISGLSLGVLVVEAAPDSGSLITADFALEQNRDVFAIPGSIHAPLSRGCHALIKQGAKLVESATDVLIELRRPVPDARGRPDDESERTHPLLEAMGFAPVSVDQMAERTGMAASRLAAQLSRFEIEGRVAALPGGWFQRVI